MWTIQGHQKHFKSIILRNNLNVSEGNINWKMLNQYGDYCKKNPMRWKHWRKYTERHERNTGGDWEANVYSVEYLNYGL